MRCKPGIRSNTSNRWVTPIAEIVSALITLATEGALLIGVWVPVAILTSVSSPKKSANSLPGAKTFSSAAREPAKRDVSSVSILSLFFITPTLYNPKLL
jgi:hypothetical protein